MANSSKKDENIYQLMLIYRINANLYDDGGGGKPLWPNGIAQWPVRLKDRKEFNRVNKELADGKDFIVLSQGGEFNLTTRVNVSAMDLFIAETQILMPKKEGLIVSPTGNKTFEKVN